MTTAFWTWFCRNCRLCWGGVMDIPQKELATDANIFFMCYLFSLLLDRSTLFSCPDWRRACNLLSGLWTETIVATLWRDRHTKESCVVLCFRSTNVKKMYTLKSIVFGQNFANLCRRANPRRSSGADDIIQLSVMRTKELLLYCGLPSEQLLLLRCYERSPTMTSTRLDLYLSAHSVSTSLCRNCVVWFYVSHHVVTSK